MKYYELDNAIYRGKDAPGTSAVVPNEVLAKGVWKGTSRALAVRRDGTPLTEEEAKAFAGEDWPAEGKQ